MNDSEKKVSTPIEEKVHEAITGSKDTVSELKKAFEESLEHAKGQAGKSAQIIQQGLEQIITSLKDVVPAERKREAESALKALEEIIPSSLTSLKLSVEESFSKGAEFVSKDGSKLLNDISAQGGHLIKTLSTFGARLVEVAGDESERLKEHLERLMKDNVPRVQNLLMTVLSLTQGFAKDAASGIASLMQGALKGHQATSDIVREASSSTEKSEREGDE